MQRAGSVEGTAQGVVVLRCDDEVYPPIGEQVVDEELVRIGRIVDVFGPIERPYLAVSPNADIQIPRLLGTRLYVR